MWIILEWIYSFCQGYNFYCATPAIAQYLPNWGFVPILWESCHSSSNSTFFKTIVLKSSAYEKIMHQWCFQDMYVVVLINQDQSFNNAFFIPSYKFSSI